MRIQFGAIITAGAGKAGGQIIQRGRTGQILRNLTKPVTRLNSPSVVPRLRLSGVSSAWKFLSVYNRGTWNTLAATLTRKNKFGVAYIPNGFQIFCEFNMNSNYAEPDNIIEEAPVPMTFPVLTDFILTVDLAGASITVEWNPVIAEGVFYVLPCLYPLQSLGNSVPRGSSRYTGEFAQDDAGGADLSDAFNKRFGNVAGDGFQVAVELKIVAPFAGYSLPSVTLIAQSET